MKKLILITVGLAVLATTAFTIKNKGESATVQSVNGKDIYILSEPTRPYEVVFDYNDTYVFIGRVTINDYVNFSVKSAIKAGEKQNKQFDAILINPDKTYSAIEGKKDRAIKYKD